MDVSSQRRRRSRMSSFARRNRACFNQGNGFQHSLQKGAFFSYDFHSDEKEGFDKDNNGKENHLLVYGNPLWSEDHTPSLNKEGIAVMVEHDDKNDAFGGQKVAPSTQNDYLSYSIDSSDGEDKEACHGNETFWNSQFDNDGDDYDLERNSSASHSGSIYDMDSSIESAEGFVDQEMMLGKDNMKTIDPDRCSDSSTSVTDFHDKGMMLDKHNMKATYPDRCSDPSIESKDFLDQGVMLEKHNMKSINHDKYLYSSLNGLAPQEMVLENHDTRAIKPDHQRNVGESEIDNDSWFGKTRRILCKENDDLDQNQEKSEQENERGWEQPIGNCNTLQQLCDLRVVDGKNEVKNSRSSMLWNSFEGYKRDLSTLSEQDEDFLYRNSNMLAAFEIEENCNLSKKVKETFNGHGIKELYEDQCEDPLHDTVIRQNETSKNANSIRHPCQENYLEAIDHRNIKRISEFDDTTPWITSNSEVVDPEQQYVGTLKSFHSLHINNKMPRNHLNRAGQENTPSDNSHLNRAGQENTQSDNSSVSLHTIDNDDLKTREQECNVTENGRKEPKITTFAKALEEEVHRLQMENERLEKLLKEKEHETTDFSKERALWEQKKLSEMSIFNAFKEEETQRLRKERVRLEKQTKLLAQLPTKKERNEIEELQKKIANITSDCAKKESLQNLTINRLRRTITALTDQIQSLQDEVKRYERFLQAEWGADSRKMINNQSISMADKFQSTSTTLEQGDVEVARKLQIGSRVSTTMYWTRPQQ